MPKNLMHALPNLQEKGLSPMGLRFVSSGYDGQRRCLIGSLENTFYSKSFDKNFIRIQKKYFLLS